MTNTNQMTIEEEVIQARGTEASLGDRLEKIEGKTTVTKYELINLYNEKAVIKNRYYKEGVLINSDTTDTMPPIDVKKGDKVFVSGTRFFSRYSSIMGVRIGLFNGTHWLYDLTQQETQEKLFITIPDGVTKITVPFFADDENRYIRIFEEDEISENLYDANAMNINKYYVEGVLKTQAGVDSTPLMQVNPGDKIYASSFNFQFSSAEDVGGVRVGMFKDSVWVKDLTQYDVYQRQYIVVPEDVNQITIPFWAHDTHRAIYKYPPAQYGDNLYDASKIIPSRYYVEGKLVLENGLHTMPLIDVEEGDRIYASCFDFFSKFGLYGGIRIGFFRGDEWAFDMLQEDVYQRRYIEIPAGITRVAIPFFNDQPNCVIYRYKAGHGQMVGKTVKNELKNMKRKINETYAGDLAYARVSVLGDDLSAFMSETAADFPAEYPNKRNFIEIDKMWWKKLVNRYSMYLITNDSASGRLITWDGTTEDDTHGAAKHMAAQARIDNLRGVSKDPKLPGRGTPDIIFVYGGKNDVDSGVPVGTFKAENPSGYTDEQIAALPVDTFADAYRTMLIRLLKTYPTSKIVCILPDFTAVCESGTRLSECCDIIREACAYFCIDTISMKNAGLSVFNKNTYLYEDKFPTEAGMELIYRQIKKQI